MNIVRFYARLTGNIFIWIFVFGDLVFYKKYSAGLLCLIPAVLDAWPLIPFIRDRRKLSPLPALKSSFTSRNILAILRWFFSVLVTMAAVSDLTLKGFAPQSLITFFVGTFFLSPLDGLIFEQGIFVITGHKPFSRDVKLVIVALRNVGYWFAMAAIGVYSQETIDFQQGATFLLISVPLLFPGPMLAFANGGKLSIVIPEPVIQANSLPSPVAEFKDAMKMFGPKRADTTTTDTAIIVEKPVERSIVIEKKAEPKKDIAPGKAAELESLKEEFAAIAGMAPQKRGYAFQDFLTRLFAVYDFSARSAFRITGEEIDGSFEIESQIYLLEAKWQAKQSAQADLLIFNSKVEGKSTWARGIFISYSGFTADGLKAFAHGKRTSIIGMDGKDLLSILDGKISLVSAIKGKARRAVETNSFFVPVSELL